MRLVRERLAEAIAGEIAALRASGEVSDARQIFVLTRTRKESQKVAEALAARGIPFVFTTGYGQSGLPERYKESPVLQKPFRMRELEDALGALALKLGKPFPSDAASQ